MSGVHGWSVERREGTAAQLCGPWPVDRQAKGRVVAICHVSGPALVLGSAQPIESVATRRCVERGVEVVRRPAGGGAVLVLPTAQVWIDLWIPRGDTLWDDDIVGSARWPGEAWARALGALGVAGLEVHRGRSVGTHWSRVVCFAGLGPGELTAAGAKVMGIAQRRVREGARFLTVAPLRWVPSALVELLSLEAAERVRAASDLAPIATGLHRALPSGVDSSDASVLETVEREVLGSLP